MPILFATYAFILGAIIGSFLNVVIHRLPLDQSLVRPPSHCPRCNAPIRWYDNIPIVSFAILRGHCRACSQPISSRYVLVELANALFYLAIYLESGLTLASGLIAAVVSMMIALIYIDLDHMILPDVIDLPGIAVGCLIGWLGLGERYPNLVLSKSLTDALIGAVAGAGIILTMSFTYKLIRKTDGMGLGDVKMMAMIGAVCGWRPLLPILFLGSIVGSLVGVGLAMRDRQGLQFPLPFGIFLGLGTLAVIFFGHTLFEWYLSLLLN